MSARSSKKTQANMVGLVNRPAETKTKRARGSDRPAAVADAGTLPAILVAERL